MLHIHNLHFQYRKGQPVLQGLDLQLTEGERHGIMGANGAGKTTLFHLLAGILPWPKEGVKWHGERQSASFLEAEPYFYPYMTGGEYLRFISDRQDAIERWNRLFELPLEEFADEYSTGMKKKLGLMGVLLQEERPLLILDEPFNGVDYESNEKMMAVLEHGPPGQRTVLISSHILPTLTRVCDRISVLKEGRIARTYTREAFAELEAQVKSDMERIIQTIW